MIALRTTGSGGAVAFMGYDSRGYWRAGITPIAADGSLGATSTVRDHDFPDVLNPVIGYDTRDRLHLVYVANNLDRPGNRVRYRASSDDGATFADVGDVFNESICGLSCYVPHMVIAAGSGGAADVAHVIAVTALTDGSNGIVYSRAITDSVMPTFTTPVRLAMGETDIRARRTPAVASLGVGVNPGELWLAWVETNRDNQLALYGDVINRVRVRQSSDGGRTWNAPRDLGRPDDAPISQMPWVSAGGGAVHVTYVRGGLTGAWDVVLATTLDSGASWTHRIVNDDPDRCATHAFVGMAAGRDGDAHVVWLDNRFGNGMVVYARCPADPRQRCGRNEAVSTDPCALSTADDPRRGQGSLSSMAVDSTGRPWAAWTDSRSGGPGVYVSR